MTARASSCPKLPQGGAFSDRPWRMTGRRNEQDWPADGGSRMPRRGEIRSPYAMGCSRAAKGSSHRLHIPTGGRILPLPIQKSKINNRQSAIPPHFPTRFARGRGWMFVDRGCRKVFFHLFQHFSISAFQLLPNPSARRMSAETKMNRHRPNFEIQRMTQVTFLQ